MSNIRDRLKKLNERPVDELEVYRKRTDDQTPRLWRGLAMGIQDQLDKRGRRIDAETPSGTLNGSNKTLTLANTPSPVSSFKLYVNGSRQTLTTDYTISGKTITTVVAYPSGTDVRADYRY